MVDKLVRMNCNHGKTVAKSLHRVKKLQDGWTLFECVRCGGHKYSKPMNELRKK